MNARETFTCKYVHRFFLYILKKLLIMYSFVLIQYKCVHVQNRTYALTIKITEGLVILRKVPVCLPTLHIFRLQRKSACDFGGLLGSLRLLLRAWDRTSPHWPEVNDLTTTL